MRKHLLIILLFGIQFALQSQILEPIKWKIQLNEKEIQFTAKIDKGWHLYAMNLPEGGPVSTSFQFEKVVGATLIGKVTPISKAIRKMDAVFNMELSWFANEAIFVQKYQVTEPGKFQLSGFVQFMGCNDESCLPPTPEKFSFSAKDLTNQAKSTTAIPVKAKEAKDETINSDIPKETSPSLAKPVTAAMQTIPIDTTQKVASDNSELNKLNGSILWTPVIKKLQEFSGVETTDSSSWWWLLLSGFLGGLLALLTPCVWPIIPMTVSFFLKKSKDRKKSIRDALLYGLSIVTIYLILGLGITILFGASALNSLSTNAFFNLLFFGLLVLFAVSFFGAFELVLPSSWTNKMDQKADSTSGLVSIFFMAFTLVLVSFSCTGPIIGTLLVQAAAMNSITGPAIGMFGFALALAIPFSFFAIFPNMLQNLPKSGSWLNTVKVVLGFLELAFAFKFLSVADLAYGWGILDRETFLSIWIVLFAMLGFYLLGKIQLPHDSKPGNVSVLRLLMSITSFAFAIYMIPGLWGAPLKSISAFTPPASTQDFNLYKNEVHAAFDDYEAGMEYARKLGKPVMIDFSGYGCVNCRKMENSVWQDSRVKKLLEEKYVLITLMVDNKKSLAESYEIQEFGKTRTIRTYGDKWSYLQRYKFGSNAQPFYVLLDNQGKPIGPGYAYNEDVDQYIRFLENGLKNY